MNVKKLMAMLLALCLMLAMCACGNANDNSADAPSEPAQSNDVPEITEEQTPEETEAEAPAGTVYTVTLVDEGGNPIVGTLIQICQGELCLMPCATDANGVATFTVTEDGAYEAKLVALPEGYEYTSEEQVFPFGGAYELTITLKAVA